MSEQPESKPAASPLKELSGRIGRYDILKPLGKGAMGVVYLAHDTMLERDVALKVMVSQIADDPELNQRFIREAKAVARMTHPNVVQVFDLGHHTDGSPFIAMELLKGQDLQKTIRTPPPMLLDRKVSVIVQVLAGLAHAHQQGIVHRDIKPANVFINQDGTVKIMDFGVARLTTASMTGTGNIVGTADYMSPEQVKGAKVDGRSDLFSVGCMLFELLAGRRPFHSDNLMAIFYKITHEEPNFDLIPSGNDYEALMPVLRKSLAKNLEDRHQTAYEFAVELRDYLKRHGSAAASMDTGLESLLDLDAGPTPPPLDHEPDPTVHAAHGPATMDLGPTVIGQAATAVGARTTLQGPGSVSGTRGAASAPTVIGVEGRPSSGTRHVAPRPQTPRPGPPVRHEPPAPSGNPLLYVALGGLVVLLALAGGYIYLNQQKPIDPLPPATTLAVAPPTTLAPPPSTLATPPPTAAPPPTFAEAQGRGAAAMRAASSAFRQGDYDRAIGQAQAVLKEDPGNADAKRLVENALSGQKAEARFAAAEAALRQNDFDKAHAEAEAGRKAASWDPRGPALMGRIQRAQEQAQQSAQQQAQQQRAAQAAAQTNSLLNQADSALQQQKYDAAIGLYDEVLKVDPTNQRATLGKTSAVGARAVAQAAGQNAGRTEPAGKAFVSGKTSASSTETRSGGPVPEGFEDNPGVGAKKGSTAADLPGKIQFDIEPSRVKPGDRYTVKIYLLNEGGAPIQVRDMTISLKVNGKGVSQPVPPQARDVAPQQKALLLSVPDLWKEDTSAWAMEATVRTVRGERYTNQVTWK